MWKRPPAEHTAYFKRLRRQQGWGQSDLAEHIGVHLSTVKAWERGTSVPQAKNVPALLESLSVRYEDLFTDTL